MATSQSTIEFLLEQMRDAHGVIAKKMFGEYGIFYDGKMVALVCDEQLFVKPTKNGQNYLSEGEVDVEMAPPYQGAKPYFLISGDKWEDADWLAELIRITAAELPLPKPKKASTKKTELKPAKAKKQTAETEQER